MTDDTSRPRIDPQAIRTALREVEEPLTVIHAYVDLLMDESGAGGLSDSQRSFVRTIRESARQLDEMLEVLRVLGAAGAPPR